MTAYAPAINKVLPVAETHGEGMSRSDEQISEPACLLTALIGVAMLSEHSRLYDY
jgi:hypothetical protein